MAQIQSLYVGGSIGNLEGIQYAKNVNYLQIYLYADWVNGNSISSFCPDIPSIL